MDRIDPPLINNTRTDKAAAGGSPKSNPNPRGHPGSLPPRSVRSPGCHRQRAADRGPGAANFRPGRPAITRAPEPVALALWPVGQVAPATQRSDGWHPDTFAHPGKMLPELAERIVATYSSPGDVVVDPMCGTGTTLLAAARLGRRAVGVEIEERWAGVASANLDLAGDAGTRAKFPARVVVGDCRGLPALLPDLVGKVALIATSPPYGCDVGVPTPYTRRAKRHLTCAPDGANYSADRSNLGHARGAGYRAEMERVYAACYEMLRPGGLLVTVTKNTRRSGRCLDLLGETVALAEDVGFVYLQHVIALHAAIRDGELCSRPSFWQISAIRRAQARGEAAHLVAHEDVALFMVARTPRSSRFPKGSREASKAVRNGQ